MGRSLMPESVLQGLTDEQLRDFFAYLRISQPISKRSPSHDIKESARIAKSFPDGSVESFASALK